MSVLRRNQDGRMERNEPGPAPIDPELLERLAKLIARELAKVLRPAASSVHQCFQDAANAILPQLTCAVQTDASEAIGRHASASFNAVRQAAEQWKREQTNMAQYLRDLTQVMSKTAQEAQRQVCATAGQQQNAINEFLAKINEGAERASVVTLTRIIREEIEDLELRKMVREEITRAVRETVRELMGDK